MPGRNPAFAGLRVLLVEDEALIAEEMSERLKGAGFVVVGTPDTGRQAVTTALNERPDLVLMDIHLKGDMDGIDAAQQIRDSFDVPLVFLTALADQRTLENVKQSGALGYVQKPVRFDALLVAIDLAIDRFRTLKELADHRLTHEAILEGISDGVIATDASGRVRFINRVAERLTGWQSREARGQRLSSVLRAETAQGQPSAEHLFETAMTLRMPAPFDRDAVVVGRAGTRVPVDGGIACIIDSLGRLIGATVLLRDVTDARRAEAELHALALQFRAVFDTALDGVLLLGEAGEILMFNPACERLFGYSSAEVAGRSVDLLLPSPLPRDAQSGVDRRFGGAAPGTALRKDGSGFPVEVSTGEARAGAQALYVCVVRDTTERRRLEAALLDAIGAEQRRFGSDLHDGLGQELTGLSMLLKALARTARAANALHAADLEQAHAVAQHALQSCHGIAQGLSPMGGMEGGLIAGLRDLAARMNSPSGPEVVVTVSEVARLGLSDAATDHLYRIAQEALANAVKHARARSIRMNLEVGSGHVRLEICDDGEGLTPFEAAPDGLGLRTMQYRASIIGARLSIGPKAPRGTCVICDCPQAA